MRRTTVTISLTNTAPGSGLPAMSRHTQRHRSYPVKLGDNRLEVSYLAPAGAVVTGVTVDGAPATVTIGSEHQHPLYTADLELPHGRTRTIVFNLIEPGSAATPMVLRQPLVRPLQVSIENASCDGAPPRPAS